MYVPLHRQIGKMLNAREPKIVNGPEILDKYVGESEANIRKLFAPAEEEEKRVGVRGVKVCFKTFFLRNFTIIPICPYGSETLHRGQLISICPNGENFVKCPSMIGCMNC